MIIAPVRASFAAADRRLDARYHCSPGVQAAEHLALLRHAGVPTPTVGGIGGLGAVRSSARSRRVLAGPGEAALAYLRPYDVFDYLPQPASWLSASATDDVDALKPVPGTILQTCSGRNLGPLTVADRYLARFALSDDMLQVRIDDEADRLYTAAFLSTSTGQHLLTRHKTGGVIDHLSAPDLAAIEVPIIASVRDDVVRLMRSAINGREAARLRLDEVVAEYETSLPPIPSLTPLRTGWSTRAGRLAGRLDAGFHSPAIHATQRAIQETGGVRCGDVATSFLPGRYKRYYVDAEYGRPIVSGRQLLQAKAINLRHIAPRSIDYDLFALGSYVVAFGAEGRAEDRIAQPVLITPDRADWMANNHVMRVRPREGVNAGWLYLAFSVAQTQLAVKAASRGSVVDAVYPFDLDEIILPPVNEELGDEARRCWDALAAANAAEAAAVETIESAIAALVGLAVRS